MPSFSAILMGGWNVRLDGGHQRCCVAEMWKPSLAKRGGLIGLFGVTLAKSVHKYEFD